MKADTLKERSAADHAVALIRKRQALRNNQRRQDVLWNEIERMRGVVHDLRAHGVNATGHSELIRDLLNELEGLVKTENKDREVEDALERELLRLVR